MINGTPAGRLAAATLFTLVLCTSLLAVAAPAVAQGDPFVELLRQDIKTDKVAIMTEAMALSTEQGDVFWPIYREYQGKMSVIGDRHIALIKDFAAHFEAMTPDKADDLLKEWFKLDEDRRNLLKKTAKNVSKKLDPIVAARFVQVEHVLNMVIDLQVAGEMPLFQ